MKAEFQFGPFTIEADGSGISAPAGALVEALIADALARDFTGAYSIEGVTDEGVPFNRDLFGPIPHGTLAHTIAAIESLPGGAVLSIEGDEA